MPRDLAIGPVIRDQPDVDARCTSITKTGERCRSMRLDGRSACFFHDQGADSKAARTAGARKGHAHQRSPLPGDFPPLVFNSRDAVSAFQTAILERVCTSQIDPSNAKVACDISERLHALHASGHGSSAMSSLTTQLAAMLTTDAAVPSSPGAPAR